MLCGDVLRLAFDLNPDRRPAERLEIAYKLYEALLAQNPDRMITLCDRDGRVVACHRARPEQGAPEISS